MRKAVCLSVRVLLGLATMAVVGALLLAWRLEKHPLQLDGLLPIVERALAPGDAETSIAICQLMLVRSSDGLMLRANDVRATDADGAEVISIPTVLIDVSLKALLTEGVFAPKAIVLEGLDVTATIQQDGGVSVGVQRSDPARQNAALSQAGPIPPKFDATRFLALWESDERLRHLGRINLAYGNIVIVEPSRGFAWRAPNVSASLVRSGDGLIFEGGGLMRQQTLRGEEVDRPLGEVSWVVQAQQSPTAAGEQAADISVELTLEAVDPTILTGIIPPLVGERGLEAPISGTVTASFPAGRWPSSAAFVLLLGRGQISIPNNGVLAFEKVRMIGEVSLEDISVKLDQLVLDYGGAAAGRRLRLNGTAKRAPNDDILVEAAIEGVEPTWLASLSPAFAHMDGVNVALSGDTKLVFDREGSLRQGELRVAGKDAAVTLPSLFEAPVTLAMLEADLRLRDFGAEWSLERLDLSFNDGASARIVGKAHRQHDGGQAEFQITGRDFQFDTVKRFWPIPVSPPAREWVQENIKSGKAPSLNGTIRANIGAVGTPLALSDIKVDVRIPMRDVDLTYWAPLPGATGIDADARITERVFEAEILRGETAGMTATGGKIRVTGIDKGKGHELLDLEIETEGPAAKLMGILNRPPLRFARFLHLEPDQLKGQVSGKLQVMFPPVAELTLDDLKISASGRTKGALLPGIAGGRDLSDADLTFDVNKQELHLKGDARVSGAAVSVSGHMPFADQSAYRGRYVMIGRFGNGNRAAFGLDGPAFQPPYMDGPAGVILTATERPDGKTQLDLELDLTKVALSVPAVGWAKRAGNYAAGQARLLVEDGALRRVSSFQLSGPGMRIAGNARFAVADGRPTVRLRSMKLGGGTDLPVTIRPLPTAGYEVELGKGRLDLRPVVFESRDEKTAGATPKDGSPVRIKLNGPDVRVRSGPPFQNMQGELFLRGDNIVNAELTGHPGGAAPAVVQLTPDGELRVTAGDGGALLATLGIPGQIEGGTLNLEGTASPDLSVIDAQMRMTDFKLVEAPVMMRVLQLASITGPLELLAGSSGLPMTALEAPFTLRNKKLTVKEGRVYGGSLGVTFRGSVDIPSQSLDFNGAVVPVYVLNRLLSSVPLVGDLLTGGEGVFAVSYSISGKYDDPQVNVMPLSLLAPGALRRLLLD